MKKYISLEISNPDIEKLKQLFSNMKEASKEPFSFMKQASAEYAKNLFLSTDKAACFKTARKSLFEACVWILVSDTKLKVTNITSEKNTILGIDSYNQILNAFYEEFVSKHTDESFVINLSEENENIADLIDEQTFSALQLWESTCNRITPLDNNVDRLNWLNFIIAHHVNNDNLTPEMLISWLVEDCKWNSEVLKNIAEELGSKFEYGIDLLNHYSTYHETKE